MHYETEFEIDADLDEVNAAPVIPDETDYRGTSEPEPWCNTCEQTFSPSGTCWCNDTF